MNGRYNIVIIATGQESRVTFPQPTVYVPVR